MLKLIGWVIKVTLFSVLILILGNSLKWRGKTISDQIRTHLSHAEWAHADISPAQLQIHVRELKKFTDEARQSLAVKQKNSALKVSSAEIGTETSKDTVKDDEELEIPPSERQKLRALIRELNGSRGRGSQ